MLYYFFENTAISNDYLFTDKAIWENEKCRALQGQFPVIFLTFKDVKETSWEMAKKRIKELIAEEYERHKNTVQKHTHIISINELRIFEAIINEQEEDVHLSNSLYFLSKLLEKIANKRVILLIDEYDAPIHAAYQNGYYDQMVEFMQPFLSAGLKDNKHLSRAVLTGILRTAKEGIFSGLNNLNVCTLLHDSFADKFGFLEKEVDDLLLNQDIAYEGKNIKNWYNGYHVGNNTLLYNPWSIIECARNKGELKAYWINTSDNTLIKKLIALSNDLVKTELESLLTNIPLTKTIEEAFIFPGIEQNQKALWSLLLFSGYATYSQMRINKWGYNECSLVIPNKEIYGIYTNLLQSIFDQSLKNRSLTEMLIALQNGDAKNFADILQEFIANSMSYYDLSTDEPEKSYHLFILGMLIFFNDEYNVRSNRESGYGRYDLMLIPKDKKLAGIIIECKKANSDKQKTLEVTVNDALKQVKEKNYKQELIAQSITNIIVYAIAFHGKKLLVKAEKL
jgi:Predicted AAA-ATPase/PD-(D/E)XK nuclease superfamily